MSDKAREEFEQEFPPPDGVFWNEAFEGYDELRTATGDAYYARYEAWLAAKEKYEPRWIDVRKSTPEEDGDVLCLLAETDAVVVAFSFNSFFVNNDVECDLLLVTHWMPLPSAPSTQGGGE